MIALPAWRDESRPAQPRCPHCASGEKINVQQTMKGTTTIWTWRCAKCQADCEIERNTDEGTPIG
jgi:transcription elongation factor Elf1